MPTPLYHLTLAANLPSILQSGALYCDLECQRLGLQPREAAYSDLKRIRRKRRVTVPPGGVLADYVPFYFAPRSPMLYAIMSARIAGARQDDMIYLVSSTERIAAARLAFVFTDQRADLRLARQFTDLADLNGQLDWPVLRARMWRNDPEHPDRKQKRLAEFLVHRMVPWHLIERVVVRRTETHHQVSAALAHAGRRCGLAVEPRWYFTEVGHDDHDGTRQPAGS